MNIVNDYCEYILLMHIYMHILNAYCEIRLLTNGGPDKSGSCLISIWQLRDQPGSCVINQAAP